jgi:hypothetical protein
MDTEPEQKKIEKQLKEKKTRKSSVKKEKPIGIRIETGLFVLTFD